MIIFKNALTISVKLQDYTFVNCAKHAHLGGGQKRSAGRPTYTYSDRVQFQERGMHGQLNRKHGHLNGNN